MTENPTSGDQDYTPPQAPMPPAGPVPPAAPTPPAMPTPPDAPKPKLDVGFFILGFVTPWVVGGLGGLLLSGVASLGLAFVGTLGPLFFVAIFIGQIAAWLIGRTNGNNRLRSWGVGGVVAVMVMALAAMLFFGACLISLNNSGL